VIIVDTSVWVEVFRKSRPLVLESVVSFDEVATCLPVIQEVLQGFRDERAYRLARQSFEALPLVEPLLGLALFEEAAMLYRAARRAGLTVRSSVDCLIAACAIRHDIEVVHRDRDFTALASVCALRARRI
jgi:predicted nucleic acid-binding protein